MTPNLPPLNDRIGQADLNFTMIGTKVFIRHALSPVNEIFRVRPLIRVAANFFAQNCRHNIPAKSTRSLKIPCPTYDYIIDTRRLRRPMSIRNYTRFPGLFGGSRPIDAFERLY